eukprot:TRINITY_DN16_c0_g4_i1.p1 TRINITY_DN16_c0_g4~~TRINITY_DN16_c0_g4_i1.p1  ORF type:complete len:359 (+),score=141.78 TRINITY_DN16_c0_g4_i1:66-1079(+)
MRSTAVAAAALCAGHASALDFLSIGDWGDSGAKQIAPAMGTYSPEFVLAIGDNFYDTGVKGVNDTQFKTKFEDTFTAPSLQSIPWFVTAGNHDYYGGTAGVNAEIEYSQRSKRWVFPSFYYSRDVTGKDGTTMTVVAVDTWRINGGDTHVFWDSKLEKGVVRDVESLRQHLKAGKISQTTHDLIMSSFAVPDSPVPELKSSGDDAQLQWLDQVLANSTADWKVVLGHFPVHSCSVLEHGDTKSLKTYLEPILEKHGVDVYFSGHDHLLQHIQLNGVNYVGSGAGARHHSLYDPLYKGLKGHLTGQYGFTHHSVSKSEMNCSFIGADSKTHYSFTVRK